MSTIKRPYPDNWPWGTPHKHPEDDTPPPFRGFDVEVPEEGTAISNLASAMRETKMALNSVVSVPATFACDVEDGDIVIPLPCEDNCNDNCDELLKTLRDLGQIPDAVWIPAFRSSTDKSVSALSAIDVTDYEPPFMGVAYKEIGRVMVGPVVAHPRYKFHTGDKIYAGTDGDLTTTENGSMIGVCLAPGSIFLLQYASSLKTAMEDLYSNAISDTITKIEQKGLDGDKIKVTASGTTVERSLEVRFGDVVNVKDFGAKGDGKTNDTNAFNLAIARAQQLGSNVCLFVPVGTYLVTTLPDVPCYGPGSIKFGSYTYSPFELLFKVKGAIQRDTNGRFKVDFSKMSASDLAALIKQLLPESGGGLTTDEDGKLVVDFGQMTKEEIEQLIKDMLPEGGGGLTTDEDGKLIIDFSQMTKEQLQDLINQIVQEGGGLNVDENGQIYVDFENMPTDKFEAMLKSIRVPIWITSTKYFYVDPVNGSDTLDDGRGESSSKPFQTIKACLSYVTENYNINSRAIEIRLAAGTYNEGGIELGEFSRTTGYISILPAGEDYSAIINDTEPGSTFHGSGGSWYLRGLKITKVYTHPNDGVPRYPSVISATAGTVHLEGCDIALSYSGEAPASGQAYIRAIASYDAGEITFDPTTRTTNRIVVDKGNANSLEVLFAERNGVIKLLGSNMSEEYCKIKAYGSFTTFAISNNGVISHVGGANYSFSWDVPSDQTASGKRYASINRGYINTRVKGPTFFPGDTDGTVEEVSYSVYL